MKNAKDINQQKKHEQQIMDFWNEFYSYTKKHHIFSTYISTHTNRQHPDISNDPNSVAIDFGCGTGWLARKLAHMGVKRVYGIDASVPVLIRAFEKTPSDLIRQGRVIYRQEIPDYVMGRSSITTSVLSHFLCSSEKDLREKFFKPMKESLNASGGEVIITSCPSAHILDTPSHYFNSIHETRIPEDTKKNATQLSIFRDKDGFIPLAKLPVFPLVDGMDMKTTFQIFERDGGIMSYSQRCKFWSDGALEKAAQDVGLVVTRRHDLPYFDYIKGKDFPHAYRMTHYMVKSGLVSAP